MYCTVSTKNRTVHTRRINMNEVHDIQYGTVCLHLNKFVMSDDYCSLRVVLTRAEMISRSVYGVRHLGKMIRSLGESCHLGFL